MRAGKLPIGGVGALAQELKPKRGGGAILSYPWVINPKLEKGKLQVWVVAIGLEISFYVARSEEFTHPSVYTRII